MIGDTIPITIGTACIVRQAAFFRTGIFFIEYAITIAIARRGAAIDICPTGFIRAGIFRIGKAILDNLWSAVINAGLIVRGRFSGRR